MIIYSDELKATDNMKVGVAQANVERNHAVQQMMRLKQELDQADRDRHAVSIVLLAQCYRGLSCSLSVAICSTSLTFSCFSLKLVFLNLGFSRITS
jgi:hypothetical protein